MESYKLISMVSFVLADKSNYDGYSRGDYGKFNYNHILRLEKYANFLNTPLNLSMFVPCVKVGDKFEVIYEPKRNYWDMDLFVIKSAKDVYDKKLEQYQKAKENVLFEGFEVPELSRYVGGEVRIHKLSYRLKDNTIESLLSLKKFKPTLTEQGMIKSGLK